MTKKLSRDNFVHEYDFDGLKGRYGHWPAFSAAAKRTFVIVYGQHATIERIVPIIEAFRHYGDVYLADNPGFGGMDSPFKQRRYPDLKFYADHLAHFVEKYLPPERALTLVGISFGFQVVTSALGEHPRLNSRVEEVVSLVGFVHYQDLIAPRRYMWPLIYLLGAPGRTRFGSKIVQAVMKEKLIVGTYMATKPIQVKFKNMSGADARRYAREQAWLWIVNDVRTHSATAWDFVKKNDLTGHRIPLNVTHIGVPKDHIIDNQRVITGLKKIFKTIEIHDLNLDNHAPLDIDTPQQVLDLLPAKVVENFAESRNARAVTA